MNKPLRNMLNAVWLRKRKDRDVGDIKVVSLASDNAYKPA